MCVCVCVFYKGPNYLLEAPLRKIIILGLGSQHVKSGGTNFQNMATSHSKGCLKISLVPIFLQDGISLNKLFKTPSPQIPLSPSPGFQKHPMVWNPNNGLFPRKLLATMSKVSLRSACPNSSIDVPRSLDPIRNRRV